MTMLYIVDFEFHNISMGADYINVPVCFSTQSYFFWIPTIFQKWDNSFDNITYKS